MTSMKPIQLAYNTFEPAHGITNESPVIFLHGLTSSKENWYDVPQIVANATNRKVYSLDSRNHGDTAWTDEFSFEVNLVDLLHFMDQIKADKVILVGHSMGGMTSINAALKVPARIEKIVVEDMSVRKDNKQSSRDFVLLNMVLMQEAVKLIPNDTTMENAKKFIADFIFNSLPDNIKREVKRSNGDSISLRKNTDGSYSLKANMKVLEESFKKLQSRPVETVGTYNGPACFIYGKKSPLLVNEDEKLIKLLFPNAKLVGIEDASHSVHVDCPGSFKEALLGFLKD